MTKRLLAGALWCLALWNAGAMAEYFVGVPVVFGLVLGVALGVVVALDPHDAIWRQHRSVGTRAETDLGGLGKAPEAA